MKNKSERAGKLNIFNWGLKLIRITNHNALNTASRIISGRRYLRTIFNMNHFLMKSLTAVYIAAATPSSERIIVNMGVSSRKSLSSLVPPQTEISIIASIWNASPEYFT